MHYLAARNYGSRPGNFYHQVTNQGLDAQKYILKWGVVGSFISMPPFFLTTQELLTVTNDRPLGAAAFMCAMAGATLLSAGIGKLRKDSVRLAAATEKRREAGQTYWHAPGNPVRPTNSSARLHDEANALLWHTGFFGWRWTQQKIKPPLVPAGKKAEMPTKPAEAPQLQLTVATPNITIETVLPDRPSATIYRFPSPRQNVA